jgi:hypothetical protein
MAGKRR